MRAEIRNDILDINMPEYIMADAVLTRVGPLDKYYYRVDKSTMHPERVGQVVEIRYVGWYEC